MGQHRRAPEPVDQPRPDDLTGVLRRIVLVTAGTNAATGVGFLFAQPGTAPSIVFLGMVAPLPIWGALYVAVAVLLLIKKNLAGHLLAVPLWLMFGLGSVFGLLGGSTRSPAATVALTGLVLGMAAMHINGLVWRRQARARRSGH